MFHVHSDHFKNLEDLIFVDDKLLVKQVLMFYHLKTRHCVNTVHIADTLISLSPF